MGGPPSVESSGEPPLWGTGTGGLTGRPADSAEPLRARDAGGAASEEPTEPATDPASSTSSGFPTERPLEKALQTNEASNSGVSSGTSRPQSALESGDKVGRKARLSAGSSSVAG